MDEPVLANQIVVYEKNRKKRYKKKQKNNKKFDHRKEGGSKYNNLKKRKKIGPALSKTGRLAGSIETRPVQLLFNFWFNISSYLKNQTIKKYLEILGINTNNFSNETTQKYKLESQKLVKLLFKYPIIMNEIYKYTKTRISKLDFLEKFSPEQIKYITNLDIADTKLIACAGSGKTRSIIGRIKFLVEHKLVKKDDVYAITFSKHAATDFKCKIKNLFPDFNEFCKLKNFSTIDSLAKSILCRVKSHKSENVEILSIALRNYLKEMSVADVEMISKIKNIKQLFVDEAQDLNEVQYDIIMLLKEKFGTRVHLVGDPNQNIFQFRRSSGSYLINFDAKKYELTLNFRSTQQIIDFSEGLKPVATSISKSATNKSGPSVTIITKAANEIHKMLLYFIKLYGKTKDLSNIAIICPTRGIGAYESVGLSVFFNLFKMHNIPFKQLYNESGQNNEKKRNVDREPGYINLLTYHGTKGLEFDVVFVMDFYQFIFNIKPTEEEHKINQYLLYVACSRAISMMFVCTYTNVHGGYLNHWITNISSSKYVTDLATLKRGSEPLGEDQTPKIPHLSFREKNSSSGMTGITDIIVEISDEELDKIHDVLDVMENEKIFTRRVYKDFTHINRGNDETLFGIFAEELFYLQYYLSRQMNPRKLLSIEKIICSNFIIIDNDSDCKALKTYLAHNKLTWKKYDKIKNFMPERITLLINKYFSREKEINDCMVCTDEFRKIVEDNKHDIKKTYLTYLSPNKYDYDYKKIIKDFFYLIVVIYAYDIHHYYYICNHGKEKEDLLTNGDELFEEINRYVRNNYLACELDIKPTVQYKKLMLCGEIDFMERYYGFGDSKIPTNVKNIPEHIDIENDHCCETIVEIKCVKEISIRYYIQLLLYNFCYYQKRKQYNKIFSNKFKIVNLLTGLEHYVMISISATNMFNLLITMANVGNLTFNNMNLIYDLETNNRIEIVGPLDYQPKIPRSIVTKHGNKYYAKVYPEIIEISIKDYETGMVLLNTLVKPTKSIPAVIQELTGIKPLMLMDKPNIETIKK